MTFLHYSDIETQKSQSTSYLGLNQVKNCRRILNTWRNIAASVGLDLDSSALWVMVLYFGHGFGQGPIKNVFKCSDSDNRLQRISRAHHLP
jgi:hypothetical protein